MSYHRYRFLYPRYEQPEFWPSPAVWPPNPPPRRVICLDLDETLVKTWEYAKPREVHPDIAPRTYEIKFGADKVWGVKRPYLDEFLTYCRRRFDLVLVWTAGLPEYAEQIVKRTFVHGFQPDRVYSRPHCQTDRYGLYKPLDKIYEDLGVKPSELLMVDNNHTVIPDIHHGNLIHIPDYEPHPLKDDTDDSLLELTEWLKAEPLHNDVRNIDKTVIFKSNTPTLFREN